MLRSQLVLACGSNILTSINALAKGEWGPEIPRTYIKPNAGCCVRTVREFFAGESSGSSGGSISTSLQTSSRISAKRSLRELFLRIS